MEKLCIWVFGPWQPWGASGKDIFRIELSLLIIEQSQCPMTSMCLIIKQTTYGAIIQSAKSDLRTMQHHLAFYPQCWTTLYLGLNIKYVLLPKICYLHPMNEDFPVVSLGYHPKCLHKTSRTQGIFMNAQAVAQEPTTLKLVTTSVLKTPFAAHRSRATMRATQIGGCSKKAPYEYRANPYHWLFERLTKLSTNIPRMRNPVDSLHNA
jgi:hypothetical protein